MNENIHEETSSSVVFKKEKKMNENIIVKGAREHTRRNKFFCRSLHTQRGNLE